MEKLEAGILGTVFRNEENGWTAISMKDDWKTIYGDSVTKK